MEQTKRQRQFEEVMLSEVTEEQREAIWQTAQQKAVSVYVTHCGAVLDKTKLQLIM